VSVVRFHSTHLNTLSASPAGGPPVAVGGMAAPAGPSSSRGHGLVLEKSTGRTGPTSIHKKYISVRYSGIQKKIIYIQKT
jgi:hypothetical protein